MANPDGKRNDRTLYLQSSLDLLFFYLYPNKSTPGDDDLINRSHTGEFRAGRSDALSRSGRSTEENCFGMVTQCAIIGMQ
jgi:hypothetical protein